MTVSDPKTKTPGEPPRLSSEGRLAAAERLEREAQALRENLMKRKRQQRARKELPKPDAREI